MLPKLGGLAAPAISILLLVAGCSKSSVQLLKAGDPHVCTMDDVTIQLYGILRQESRTTRTVADYRLSQDAYLTKLAFWVKELSFSMSDVTSKAVDVQNERITCNATIDVKGIGVKTEQAQNVDYQVVADLSANKPIVTVAMTNAYRAIGEVLDTISEPDFQKAKAAEKIESDAYVAQQAAQDAKDGELRSRQEAAIKAERSNANPINAPFTPAEEALIKQADNLSGRCRDTEGSTNPSICDRSEAVGAQLKAQGICWGPEDASEADKQWIRCNK